MFLTKYSESMMFLRKDCLWCVAWVLCLTVACIGVGCNPGGDVVTPTETETETVQVTEVTEVTEGGETPVVAPEPEPVPEPVPEPKPHDFDDLFTFQRLSNPNWRWRNEPADWDVGQTIPSYLTIEAEKNRNLWASDNTHFLYQETRDDAFDIYTEFFTFWQTDSGVAGLVVKSPADNDWVTLKCWVQGEFSRVQFQGRGRGLGFPDTPWERHQIVPDAIWDGGREVVLHFRLRKEGNAYTGYYRTFGGGPWLKIGTANVALTPPLQVGVYAGNAANKGWLMAGYDIFQSVK